MAQESSWLHKVGKKLGLIKEDEGVEVSTPEVGGDVDGDVSATNKDTQGEGFHGGSDVEDSSSENTPPTNV